jgi:cation-transporting ATPase E
VPARWRPPWARGWQPGEVYRRPQPTPPPPSPTRGIADIVRANVFTRFNAILAGLLLVVAAVGPPQDGLFAVVPAVNTAIGVLQELRARRALAQLAVVTAPRARVRRDGKVLELPVEAVVAGDMIELRPGDQLIADGTVLVGHGLQVDESLITGESEPADRVAGTHVLSGSFVVAGSGVVRADAIGEAAYARRLERESRTFKLVRSELQAGTNQILRGVTWVMVPAAVLLVTAQVIRSRAPVDSALRGSVAGVGAMIPEGLVLLTSIAFALGAIRLARRRVLVQTLAAVEGLARVDVVCVDKTGTLTQPTMRVAAVHRLGRSDPGPVLSALGAADPSPNPTLAALAQAYPNAPGWRCVNSVPFSSARRWSAAEFSGHGAWVLGAPETLLGPGARSGAVGDLLDRAAEAGERVVLLAGAPHGLSDSFLPPDLRPEAVVRLQEELRPEVEPTVSYLLRQGVTVKVFSGDDPRTVAAVARRVGIPQSERGVDAGPLEGDEEALAAALAHASVFGRVGPQQKRAMIALLQAAGHVVAMTGDGVNDVAALKQADLGIAMGSGSPASRAVGQVVLLDSSFAAVPMIVEEGRRVIDNVERVAGVVVTKTVYAAILALVIGILAVPYPFYPRQLTVVSAFTIGIPGFFLALGRRGARARAGFTSRVLAFSIPAGLAAGGAVLGTYQLARASPETSAVQEQTAAALALFMVGMWVLTHLSRPLSWLRASLVAGMVALGAAAVALPLTRTVFAISFPPPKVLAETCAVAATAVVLAATWLWVGPSLLRALAGRFHGR